MASSPSRIFAVTVIRCHDISHAEKIAKLLRKSFAHRRFEVDRTKASPGFSTMVIADDPSAIRTAISPALGGAKCVCGEQFFLDASGQLSAIPRNFIRFQPALEHEREV
jgi:hypothetical protein